VLRSCITPQPASPGLAPLAPPHTGSPPAFARLRAPASGVVFRLVPHLHTTPPVPDPQRSLGNALRERRSCWRSRLARAAASGRLWHQALSSSLPALPRSCLACAAWSFLRERLTPRPPAAGGNYRFGFRQNKLGELVGRAAGGVWRACRESSGRCPTLALQPPALRQVPPYGTLALRAAWWLAVSLLPVPKLFTNRRKGRLQRTLRRRL